MPVITVQFIQDVVATPEQKRQLIIELTNKFCEILGDVVRPFVYCIIQETPQQEWGIAGVPMPDLVYLTSPEHAQVIARSNELMRGAIAQMQAQNGGDAGKSSAHAEEHRKLFTRWFDELWNKKNYDIAYELVDPDFTAHGAGGQDIKQGPNGVVEMVKAWHKAMPDGHMTLDDIVTEGDLSTIRMTWRATQTGPFGTVPASGHKVEVSSIGIDRVIGGHITEGWGELNMLGMMQQMGAIPARPPQAAPAPSPDADKDKARLERNKETVRRFHEAINTKNNGTFYELVRSDFVNHVNADVTQIGPGKLIDSMRPFRTGLPDLQVTEDDVVAEGDRVATRVQMSGTHQGVLMGAQPSGKTVRWTGLIVYRLHDDGRIIERWQDFDTLSMMMQLGVIPTPS